MIAKSWLSGCWDWKIGASVVLVGTLWVDGSVVAQILPDNTLGAESSVVTPNVDIQGIESDRLDGGATRGANLFHSFEQFNIGTERGAYFSNPAGITNIFSRVTGANGSEILGRLGVLGNANLFLINPQGIVFGSGASLDVQGSFIATTGEAIKLGNEGLFSATQPGTSNLLTVNPSAILFNTIIAQPIVNRSQAPSAFGQLNSDDGSPGLQVQSDRTLALVGGNVLLEGGRLTAAGGRIELGSVVGVGEVSLTPNGNRFVLGYDSTNKFGNISLSNAFVDASGEGGGDVQVRGARLEMAQGSNIWANTLGAENGGDILLRAPEVVLNGGSLLTADVFGTGGGGDLTIDTGRLLVQGGAQVSASTRGEGKGGSLQITASESVEVTGSSDGQASSSLSANSVGSGDAGNLIIDTGRLLVSNKAQISSSTFGEGRGGNLQITASDLVEVIGQSTDSQLGSGLFALSQGSGDAGNLTIDTRRLLVRGGAQVSADTRREGNGGSLQITASESVEAIGTSFDSRIPSLLSANSDGDGDAGNLTINTGRLLVDNGAVVAAGTFGAGKGGSLEITASESVEVTGESANTRRSSGLFTQSDGSGDAGNLTINTGRLLVDDGAVVSAGATGEGNGSSLEITASDSVEVIGESANTQRSSGLFTQSDGSGDAGSLTINTGRLLVDDGARVTASSLGEGEGGSLQVTASESVEVIGESANTQRSSSLSTQSDGSGDAGNLTINTGRLLVDDGARVTASSLGEGKGGSLQVTASESVEVIGESANTQRSSGLAVTTEGSGDAGNLTIDTGYLLLRDGAVVAAGTFGAGNGGSLKITASSSVEVIGSSADGQTGSGLSADSEGSGDAGNLTIDTGYLLLRDGAQISTGTRGEGKGGNLQITASNLVEIIGESADSNTPSGLFTASEGSGDAGNLKVDTRRLLVQDGAVVSSSSRGEGTAGDINITARDTLQADNGTISTNTSRSIGGDLTINAGNIRLFGDSDIKTNVASGADNGGSITLTAGSILAFDDSDILTFARDGRGGDIKLNTPAFFGENYRPAPSNTNPDTLDNNNQVDINARGAFSGIILIPDVSFIQNSLTELPENQINTDSLLASSCIVRRNQPTRGSFTVTGAGGLPQRPGDAQISSFPTVDVETLPSNDTPSNTNQNRSWQKGDPIVEPQGVYRLPNGKLVLSRECS